MRIAIEALGIHYYGGGRTATVNMLQALFAQDQRNDYLLILSQPEPALAVPNVRQWVAPLRNRFSLRLWAQACLPAGVRGYDVVHFAKNLGVFGIPARTVVTVYDVTPLVHPELFPIMDVWYWRYVEKLTLQSAERIIAISRNTAQDLTRLYGIPADRVAVIYPSCAPHFRPASLEEIDGARRRYGLPAEYVVHVGHIDRKKNLPALVAAFAKFRERTGFAGKLVLVGEVYQKSRDLSLLPTIDALGLKPHVALLGGVPDADMPALYSGAVMAVFPSQHEGFGLVALEAMRCGTPLIASRAGAVAEVVGDAAWVVGDSAVEPLAEALDWVWRDPALRQTMRAKGLARAQGFRWDETARQTLRLYEDVAQSCR